MGKRLRTGAALLAAAMLLSGCDIYSKEYVSVKDYVPPVQESIRNEERITVRNFSSLKDALLALAYAGEPVGKVVFDQAYEGDPAEDMANACWQVRTQDALGAYCIEDIDYEINKIVAIDEATVRVNYSAYGVRAADIQRIYYSLGMERIIKEAVGEGKYRLAILVTSSSSSAEDVLGYVSNIYREDPFIAPKEPKASVTMFSGDARQRLYEINISYGLSEEEREKRLGRMAELEPFSEEDKELPEAERVYTACEYLSTHCAISDTEDMNSAYSSLILNNADSEGIALGFVGLCRMLGLDCRIVYGQKAWEDHCWNIVKVDGDYYHVDLTETIEGNYSQGLFVNDERFWGDYRWDVASYPKCTGSLSYDDYYLEHAEAVEPTEAVPDEFIE